MIVCCRTPSSNGISWNPVVPNKREIDFLQIDSSSKIYMTSSEDLGRRKFWETLPFTEPSFTVQQQKFIKDEF